MNRRDLISLLICPLLVGGCRADAATSPSQELIERALRAEEVMDQFQQRRGVVRIDYEGYRWWIAVAGRPEKGLEPASLLRASLANLVRSSIAMAALKDNPFCVEFRELFFTPIKKEGGLWIMYAYVREDNVRRGNSCDQSTPSDSSWSVTQLDSLDSLMPEMPELQNQK